MKIRLIAALAAVVLCACATHPKRALKYGDSGGTEVGSFPIASTLTGTERILGDQNGVTVDITPSQIASFIGAPNGFSLPLSIVNGGTGGNTAAQGIANLLPAYISGDCLTNNGSILQWSAGCGGGSGAFSALAGGTNTSAAMIVGTGASLTASGSGTIGATTAAALAAAPTGCTGGQYATGIAANGNATCGTPTGAGTVNSGVSGELAYYPTSTTAVSALPTGNGLAVVSAQLVPSSINRTVSGTTDTINCTSDAFRSITYTGSGTAVTLPAATGSCGYGFGTVVENAGTGTVTITSSSTINGSSTLTLAVNRGCEIDTDATSGNYDTYACTALISGSGSVSSVGLSMPAGWTVTGSPVTGSGTLTAAFAGAIVGGTKFTFTPTGCTPSASAGGATAGTITLAAGPCTSILITMNGATGLTAPHGWTCNVGDRTAEASGTYIPGWYESASTTTTATLPIPPSVASTDVIRFSCTGY